MASTLMDTLEPPMEGFIQMGASIQTHTDHIIEGHKLIENCIIGMVTRVSDLHEAFCDTQEKAKANTLAVQNPIVNIERHPPLPGTDTSAPTPQSANLNSYTAHTSTHVPAVHSKVMAHKGE